MKRKRWLQVLPPDVQKSFSQFSIEEHTIPLRLLAVKNVGAGAVESLSSASGRRPFKSFEEFFSAWIFIRRIASHGVAREGRRLRSIFVGPRPALTAAFSPRAGCVMPDLQNARRGPSGQDSLSDGTKCPVQAKKNEEVRERRSEGKMRFSCGMVGTRLLANEKEFWFYLSDIFGRSKRSSTSFPPIA